MFCCCSEDLQQRLAGLEQERAEFLRLKQQLEAEFNQKRAKFKELYLSKEGMDPASVCAQALLLNTRLYFLTVHFDCNELTWPDGGSTCLFLLTQRS